MNQRWNNRQTAVIRRCVWENPRQMFLPQKLLRKRDYPAAFRRAWFRLFGVGEPGWEWSAFAGRDCVPLGCLFEPFACLFAVGAGWLCAQKHNARFADRWCHAHAPSTKRGLAREDSNGNSSLLVPAGCFAIYSVDTARGIVIRFPLNVSRECHKYIQS